MERTKPRKGLNWVPKGVTVDRIETKSRYRNEWTDEGVEYRCLVVWVKVEEGVVVRSRAKESLKGWAWRAGPGNLQGVSARCCYRYMNLLAKILDHSGVGIMLCSTGLTSPMLV